MADSVPVIGSGAGNRAGEVVGVIPRAEYGRMVVLTTVMPLAVLTTTWFLPPGWNLLGTAAMLTGFLLVLGKAIAGVPLALLISERNLMSLSRFQALVWTVVVMAGYLTMTLSRAKSGASNAVGVDIPQELWIAMGISTTSLLGTPLVLGGKRARSPDEKLVQNTSVQLAEATEDIDAHRQGVLYANANMTDARMADMFQGDEVGNTAHIDLAKVQMFYFTLIAAVGYFMDVAMSVARGMTSAMPALSQGMLALLAISHGGYLLGKTGDHSNSKQT
ncbi:hypothetical protein BHS09_29265 [Myxococcus xanthus]|uniref:Uncharacterized protein n=2 Tax=Myxococcus xanthus TaxID=34 RepID=A0AAE6KUS4_MYXXA|nr:hypothetical protein [Myxococcus xanthus]QDE70733.1 hypothetical protein BHS09_29265 [Myxococcus xanthus]QDE78012.1 hypothetical protein BHS08_29285 [Myxococcus xanthus]